MRIRPSYCFLILLFITAMLSFRLVPNGRALQAKEPAQHKSRNIYVAKNLPETWPVGDWQPISSKKYLQLTETQANSDKRLTQAGISKSNYIATFHQGQLINGKFSAQVNNLQPLASWQNLGQTNLSIHALGWKQNNTAWGTNLAGELLVQKQPGQTELEGQWSYDGHSKTIGTHFDFEFLSASQTTLQLTLPSSMQLRINNNISVPVFVKDLSPEFKQWQIYLSSQSSLSVSIDPVDNTSNNTLILSRQIHLLNLGVSDHHFITNIQAELPSVKEETLQLFLPKGYHIERIEIEQESLSNWNSSPVIHEQTPGILIPLAVRNVSSSLPVNILLSGKLEHFENHRLTTQFPQIINAIQGNTQVTVAVESPLLTAMLNTQSLHQIDASLGPGTRDTWTYIATGINPILDISVTSPSPQLQADQVVFFSGHHQTNNEVKHFMLWSTNDEDFFTAKFRLLPGYQVQDVTAMSDSQSIVPTTWNIRTEQDQDYLYLHLPNQLVPEQLLAVSITLQSKSTGRQKTRISLPAIQLINGHIDNNLILIPKNTSIKTAIAKTALNDVPDSQLQKWSIYWDEFRIDSPDLWLQTWALKECSPDAKILIVPAPKTDIDIGESEVLSVPSIESLPTTGKKPFNNKLGPKHHSSASPNWNCKIKAIAHQGSVTNSRVQIEYNKASINNQLFPERLKFSSEILLHSVSINNHSYAFEEQGSQFTLPVVNSPIKSITIDYSYPSDNFILLPTNDISASYDQLLLCLPQGCVPEPTESILLWQRLYASSPPGPSVPQAFPDSHSVTSMDRLFKNYRLQHGYSLFEAQPSLPQSTGNIQLTLSSTVIPWLMLFVLFLTILLTCLCLSYFYPFSKHLWFSLSLVACITVFFVTDRDLLQILFPMTVAFFVSAQLPGFVIKRIIQKVRLPEDQSRKHTGSLRYLLTGFHGLLIITLWLNAQPLSGQDAQIIKDQNAQINGNILIPITPSLLTPQFKGLDPAAYPQIIYISEKYAQSLREFEIRNNNQNDILFHSARYDAVWEKGVMHIRCLFRIIDTRNIPNAAFVLPITGIKSFPTLKAMVNGQLTDITPLPDDSGLEISLTGNLLPPENNESPPLIQQANLNVQEYLVELEIIPQHKVHPHGTVFSLGIPPAAHSQVTCQVPEDINAELIRPSQDSIEFTPLDNEETVAYQIGPINQLNLLIKPESAQKVNRNTKNIEQIQTSILAQIYPQYTKMELHAKIRFVTNTERIIAWRLPPEMVVRSAHASSSIDYHVKSLPNNESILEISFSDSNTEEHTIQVDLITPTASIIPRIEFSIPDLLDTLFEVATDHQLQIAIQADAGFELSQIQFPSIATSRITPAAFLQNWPEQEILTRQAHCFRLNKSGRISADLNLQESELSVIARHQYQKRSNQILIQSEYETDIIGGARWSVAFDAPVNWDIRSLKLTSRKTVIPTRVMKQSNSFVIAFASSIEEDFKLDINWRYLGKVNPNNTTITPPRILHTLYYRENLTPPPATSLNLWLLGHDDIPKSATTTEQLLPIQEWAESLFFETDHQSNLPVILLQARVTEQAAVIQTPEPDSLQTSDSSIQTKAPNINDSDKIVNLDLIVDHTVWREKKNWLGETLVLLPNSPQNQSKQLWESLHIQIPDQTQILDISHHQYLSSQMTGNKLSITSKQAPANSPETAFIVIQWKTPRKLSWTGLQTLFLPSTTESSAVSWRLIDRQSNDKASPISIESWRHYFQLLSKLNTGKEAPIANPALRFPEQSFPISAKNMPNLFQQVLGSIPVQHQQRFLTAQNKMSMYSWNQPTQTKITSTIDSGRQSGTLDRIVIPVEHQMIRYVILLLAIFWGWGTWQTNYAKNPKVRNRHLRFCSILIVGLMAVQFLN